MKQANKELGLPFGKMQKVIYAFDVDGTLVNNETGEPNHRIVDMLKTVASFKNTKVIVWSGGGKDYAAMWGNRMELDKYVWRYASKLEHHTIKDKLSDWLIAVDDIQDTAIGDINLIVKEK